MIDRDVYTRLTRLDELEHLARARGHVTEQRLLKAERARLTSMLDRRDVSVLDIRAVQDEFRQRRRELARRDSAPSS